MAERSRHVDTGGHVDKIHTEPGVRDCRSNLVAQFGVDLQRALEVGGTGRVVEARDYQQVAEALVQSRHSSGVRETVGGHIDGCAKVVDGFLPGGEVARCVRSPDGIVDRGMRVCGNPCLAEVQGNRADVRREVALMHGFNGLRRTQVETLLARHAQFLVQRLADERVGEDVAIAALCDHLVVGSLLHSSDQFLVVELADTAQQFELEIASQHSGVAENRVA